MDDIEVHSWPTRQIKPHVAVYGTTARDIALARAVVAVAKLYNVPFMGLAGKYHQTAARRSHVECAREMMGVGRA